MKILMSFLCSMRQKLFAAPDRFEQYREEFESTHQSIRLERKGNGKYADPATEKAWRDWSWDKWSAEPAW